MNKHTTANSNKACAAFTIKRKHILLLLLFFFVFCGNSALAQGTSKQNFSWKYQPDSPVQLRWDAYQPVGQQPVLMLQLEQLKTAKAGLLNGYLYYQDSLQSGTSLRKEILFSNLSKENGVKLFSHTIDTTLNARWLMLEIQDVGDSLNNYWYSFHLPSIKHFDLPTFYLQQQNQPLMAPYTLVTQSFSPRLEKQGTGNNLSGGAQSATAAPADSLFLFVYTLDFNPAASPMSIAPAATAQKMEISNRRKIAASQNLQPDAEGFYFLQADTLTLKGKGIRAESKYFPKTRTLADFAGPIRYLSTNEEWTELERDAFSKKALDRYWLRMTQSEDKAKKIIRSYYRRVAQANKLFTSFKEGWKTDMGMVYILYGAPDRVYQQEDGERWEYSAKGDIPEISFTFVRTVNPFDPEYYQLVRKKDYARTHFQTVSKWRRGQNLP